MEHNPYESLSHSIVITEATYAQENWLKTIKYLIKITDTSGETLVPRSSKEFKTLRKILVLHWPGCIIPTIPEAYSKKNPNPLILDQCIHVHSMFLQKINSVEYFFNSDVVQLFIRGQNDFIKATSAYKIPTYSTIAEGFESNFKDCLDYEINTESITRLAEIKNKYTLAIKTLEKLEKCSYENLRSLKEFKKGTVAMVKGLQDTVTWIDPNKQASEFVLEEADPYSRLLNWILDQIQDLSAVIEAISKVEELLKVKDITANSINNANLEIQKLAVGKKSLMSFIGGKSKDELVAAKKHVIDELTAQAKALDIIIPVVSSKLLNIEIPNIENKNLNSFDKEIRKFAEISVGDFEAYNQKLKVAF